jgi:hypothetical protein
VSIFRNSCLNLHCTGILRSAVCMPTIIQTAQRTGRYFYPHQGPGAIPASKPPRETLETMHSHIQCLNLSFYSGIKRVAKHFHPPTARFLRLSVDILGRHIYFRDVNGVKLTFIST